MDFHLDTCSIYPILLLKVVLNKEQQVFLKLQILTETSDCPQCQHQVIASKIDLY